MKQSQNSPVQSKIILCDRKYTPQEIQQFLNKDADYCHVNTLLLHRNHFPRILSSLSYANFGSLRKLSLGGNKIYSLHQLYTIKAESLEELSLWQNKITNLRSLRKVKFPNLTKIDLSSNLLVEINGLSQLDAKKLSYFNIDLNLLSSVDHLIKSTNFIQNGRLLVLSNPIIMLLGNPAKSGNHKLFRIIFSGQTKPLLQYC